VLGEIAELYRAVWPHITPVELDAYELWQIAVVLGLDEHQPFRIPQGRPWPPQPEPQPGVASPPTRRLRAVL
jgi:hypothetical protein